jgi:hypothetical protein
MLNGHRYLLFLRKNRQMVTWKTISRQSSFYYVQWQVTLNLYSNVTFAFCRFSNGVTTGRSFLRVYRTLVNGPGPMILSLNNISFF